MMTQNDVRSAIAAYLNEGGVVTIAKPSKARGVKKQVMKLAVNRHTTPKDVMQGYAQTNYMRLMHARQACALGKVGLN